MDTETALPKRYRPDRYQATRRRQALAPLEYKSGRDILSALGRYGYLTAPMIQRLLYAPGSRTHVTTWLKYLKENGYIHDENWLRVNRDGANPRVWTFTEKGRKVLAAMDSTELPKIHHRRHQQPWVLDHTIEVNQTMVTCELLAARSGGALELLGLRSDELLHKMPIAIRADDGKTANVIPDGWVAYGGPEHKVSLCVEVDRATEDMPRWKGKIAGYLKALSGDPSPYAERFGYRVPIVIVVVRPKQLTATVLPEKRLHDLMAWTEAELTEQGMQGWGKLFKFTTLAPEESDPRVFFGGAHWLTPFQTGKEPALPGVL